MTVALRTEVERETVQERVYRELRESIVTGRFVPGRPVTLRGVAVELGVSPMPVREALRQLVAERALVVLDNRRIAVPAMSASRFAELCLARTLLEPELATLALPRTTSADAAAMAAIDRNIDLALERGDTDAYMRENYAFHFRLYRAAGSSVLLPLVEFPLAAGRAVPAHGRRSARHRQCRRSSPGGGRGDPAPRRRGPARGDPRRHPGRSGDHQPRRPHAAAELTPPSA